jgi:hypothetical protein
VYAGLAQRQWLDAAKFEFVEFKMLFVKPVKIMIGSLHWKKLQVLKAR